LQELKSDPRRFQKTGGYERLLKLLETGGSPAAVKDLLREGGEFVGDILWTVCELDDLGPYVEDAAPHVRDPDRGTAAYAIEILLRAAEQRDHLMFALQALESAPIPVAEHAALVLAGQGPVRAREVFQRGDWPWAAELVGELLQGSASSDVIATIKTLIADSRPARVLVGLLLATLASEQDDRAIRLLEASHGESMREFAGQLQQMFQHRWRAR
jgi:hypothetical protein